MLNFLIFGGERYVEKICFSKSNAMAFRTTEVYSGASWDETDSRKFSLCRKMLVGPQGIALESFLRMSIKELV
jgi:hypothetical protein